MKKLMIIFVAILASNILMAQNVDLEKISVYNYDEKVINDPSIDYGKFKTYSIISENVLFENRILSLEEKQIEFFLINLIEPILGLKNISKRDSIKPDLMLIYNFSNDYKEKYIPPQTYSIPIWSRGETTKISSNSTTNLNTYGDLNVNGNISGNKNTNITKSGKWELAQVQRPAYTQGQFFPNFSMTFYNTSDNNKIWEGNANGVSKQKDFRLAAQRLIWELIDKMPKGSYEDPDFLSNNNGMLGMSFYPFNSDGVNFYPVILGIADNTPAKSQGLKDLDVIISLNGISTANKSLNDLDVMIKGNAGTKIDLQINRKGKFIKKSLVKMPR